MHLQLRRGEFDQEARDALARAAAFDTTGGLVTLEELLAAGALFELVDDGGGVRVRYVLRQVEHAHGAEVIVTAAASDPRAGFDATRIGMAAIMAQAQAAGASTVAVHTRRNGLLRKLARLGFSLDGFILRKRVRPCD